MPARKSPIGRRVALIASHTLIGMSTQARRSSAEAGRIRQGAWQLDGQMAVIGEACLLLRLSCCVLVMSRG